MRGFSSPDRVKSINSTSEVKTMVSKVKYAVAGIALAMMLSVARLHRSSSPASGTLPAPFERKILTPLPEAAFNLRFFTTGVKTDSRGRIITGPNSDPVKQIVGQEAAGERGGLQRFTKIMFGASYLDGRPDPGTRVDPNNPIVNSGGSLLPNRQQPLRSEPPALALTPDGSKLFVTLPGREGYPDWRVAVVDARAQRVIRWIDLRPDGQVLGTRPMGVKVSPVNTSIFPHAYVVVLNMYGNFASVIDSSTDAIIGEFETGFYGEKLIFNRDGT